MNSFYEILGINRSASRREIRDAFLNLAHQHHPDLNRNRSAADEQFKHVRRAYEILSDPIRRAAYDDNPGLFPLAQGHTKIETGSPVVPHADPVSGPNRFHTRNPRYNAETTSPFSFNLQPARPDRKRFLAATLFAGFITITVFWFTMLRDGASNSASKGHQQERPTPAVKQSSRLSAPTVANQDRHTANQAIRQSAGSPLKPAQRVKQQSASSPNNASASPTRTASGNRDIHTTELLFQIQPENSPLLILPQDESHTVLIPDSGATGSVIVPKEQVALLPDYVEQQRLLPNNLGSTFQQLLDTPLPEIREPTASLSPTWLEPLPPLQTQLSPTAEGTSRPLEGPSVRPPAEPRGRPLTVFRQPIESLGNPPAQPTYFPTWSRPLSFSVTPPANVAVPPTTGVPRSGRVHPGQPATSRYGPIENKHLPFQPFNPTLAQPEAKPHAAGGF